MPCNVRMPLLKHGKQLGRWMTVCGTGMSLLQAAAAWRGTPHPSPYHPPPMLLAPLLPLPQVRFAPGPWADKFRTHDGHPDHEGQLARQRRSMGAGWGRDLTPSAVRAVEAELGEACRPSIDRLKRRCVLACLLLCACACACRLDAKRARLAVHVSWRNVAWYVGGQSAHAAAGCV